MTDTPTPNRRTRRTVPTLAAAGVLAVLALGVLLARNHQDQSVPVGIASLPPASPGVVSASYVESHWRLTAVTDRRGTTAIPASIDASLELAADGTLLASDGVNAINGHFTATSTGFDVSETMTTLAGYPGNDPVLMAAVTGINAVTSGPPVMSSAPSNVSEAPPVHVTVLAANHEQLAIQGGGMRLAFIRTGPASEVNRSLYRTTALLRADDLASTDRQSAAYETETTIRARS